MTLKQFIDSNHNLLSALAIMAAVLAFISSMSIKWIGVALSFLLVGGMIFIWLELKQQMPEKKHWRLFLFHYVILWGLVAFILYWLLEYLVFWNEFIGVPIFFLVLFWFANTFGVLRQFEWAKNLFGIDRKKNGWQKLLKVVYVGGILWISLMFTAMLAPVTAFILNVIKLNFK